MVRNLPAYAFSAGDAGSVPGSGRSPGEGSRPPTPVFWPGEFSMDSIVHGVAKSRTRPNNFLFSGGLSAPLVAKTAGFF